MATRSRIPEPVKPALLAALRAQLAQGEHLVWAESPGPEPIDPEKPGLSKMESVGIVGGGYALLGSCVLAVITGQWLWLSVPIALLAVGLASFAIARWMKARATKSTEGTIYGFTTRRALIVRTYPALAVRQLPVAAITDVAVSEDRDDSTDLVLQAATASETLVFERVFESQHARTQIMRVMRDPQGAEEQIAASEAYALQMKQLMVRRSPN
jgi:hypothetical protein